MSLTKEVMERYPLSSLVFIFSTGLFMVISFPFDLSSLISSEGVVLQDCVAFFAESGKNFKPFVNVNLLKVDFVLGSTKIIIASLLVGFLFYMISDLYIKINHFFIRGKIKRRTIYRKKFKHRNKRKPALQQLEFGEWLRKFQYTKYIDFIYSVKRSITGLFYASETFFGIIILVAIHVRLFEPSWPVYLQNVLDWFLVASVNFVLFYLLHLGYEYKFANEKERFLELFLKHREKEEKEKKEG